MTVAGRIGPVAVAEEPPTEASAPTRDRWLGVEIRHLAALDAIAREGSFRAAADALGYVQSAVSQQIFHLEHLVGARLIERTRGSAPVAVTDAGQLLLQHVGAILERLQDAQSDLAALVEGRSGTLRVGAFQSVAARVFPHVMPSFARSCPDVSVVPIETQTDEPLFDMVLGGDADLAFCQLPVEGVPFEVVELMDDPFVLLVPADSPLADDEDAPSLAEIARMPLIGFNRSRAQDQVLAALRSVGAQPDFAYRSDLNSTVQALVAGGLGVAVVPYLSVDPQHVGTSVVELHEPEPRRIGLFWSRERTLPPPADTFIEAVRDTCARRFRHER